MNMPRTQTLDKMKYLEAGVRSECERMQEILRMINISWNDPGAELIKKELSGQIYVLEHHAKELRDSIAGMEETMSGEDGEE